MAMPPEAWGNRNGWITAGVIVVVMIALAWTLAGSGSVTPPTSLGQIASRWSSVSVPPAVTKVVPDDAGSAMSYRRLLELYRSDVDARRTAERLARATSTAVEEETRLTDVIDALIETTGADDAVLADEPELAINYDRSIEPLDDLHNLGRSAVQQASVFATRAARARDFDGDDAERARAIYQAVLSLGHHLAEERVIYRQWRFGTQLMADGLSGLGALAQAAGDANAADFRAASSALSAYLTETTLPLWDAIGSANNDVATDTRAETHFGDVLAIARSDQADPMWRTEAILRLGKSRFGAPRTPDRNAAERAVRQLAEDLPTGNLRTAAEQARDLDAAAFRVAR
ncbi:MAG: hypothetical protein AAGI46_02495 [Planctomycetota bacterium]